MNVTMEIDGQKFVCSTRQARTIETLSETRKGGFANVRGYVASGSGEKADHTVLTRFNLSKLYNRKIAALNAITLNDIKDSVLKNPKISALPFNDLVKAFEDRKATEIASMQKTLDGDRDDARRASHDRNYARVADGVKVHFLTEKKGELTVPVRNADGLPIVKNIMLNVIEISKNVITEGVHKVVNSGVPVLLSNAMLASLPKSTKLKTLSLGEDNFDSITIDGETLMPKEFEGDFS